MACPYPMLLVSLLLVLPIIQGIHEDEVVYTVTNNVLQTTGGILFSQSFTDEKAKNLMKQIADFIWTSVLCQKDSSDRKQVKEIKLFIDESDKWRLFIKGLENGIGEVHISEKHIYDVCAEHFKDEKKAVDQNAKSFQLKDTVKVEVRWLLTFGIAQHLQWRHDGDEAKALWYGIAAFAVMAAGYEPHSWAKAGEGTTWNEMYDVTGRFFCYVDRTKPKFVADLNKKMKTSYNLSYFKDVTGKTIDEWWSIYKKDYQRA